MVKNHVIAPLGAINPVFPNSLKCRLDCLLQAFHDAIALEAEQAHCPRNTPELDAAILRAEAARTHILACLRDILARPELIATPVGRLAKMSRKALLSQDPLALGQVRYLSRVHSSLFQLPGSSRAARAINLTLHSLLVALERFLAHESGQNLGVVLVKTRKVASDPMLDPIAQAVNF